MRYLTKNGVKTVRIVVKMQKKYQSFVSLPLTFCAREVIIN